MAPAKVEGITLNSITFFSQTRRLWIVLYVSSLSIIVHVTRTTTLKEQTMGIRALTLALTCMLALPLAAEVVVIPVGQQAADKQSLERPRRGTTKENVRKQFGEPTSISGPVGDPPITHWEYPDFSIYFEYDLVLHSVLKHVPHQDLETDPGSTE
jgi:hypothetical protein